LEVFADDVQAAFRQQRMDVWHTAGEAVFAGEHGVGGATFVHGFDGVGEAVAGQGLPAWVGSAAGKVGIGAGGALEGDNIVHPPHLDHAGAS